MVPLTRSPGWARKEVPDGERVSDGSLPPGLREGPLPAQAAACLSAMGALGAGEDR